MPLALVDETFESSKLFSADQPPEVNQERSGFLQPAPPAAPSISAPLLAVFTAISHILAAKLILLLASGGAFVLFCIALWRVLMQTSWPFSRAVLLFIASLLPFVPFFIDRRMRAWAAADSNQTQA